MERYHGGSRAHCGIGKLQIVNGRSIPAETELHGNGDVRFRFQKAHHLIHLLRGLHQCGSRTVFNHLWNGTAAVDVYSRRVIGKKPGKTPSHGICIGCEDLHDEFLLAFISYEEVLGFFTVTGKSLGGYHLGNREIGTAFMCCFPECPV